MDFSILVNKENLLASDYVPDELVTIDEPMGSKIDKNYVNHLNAEVYRNFKLMQADALKQGFEIFVDSSYRTYAYQEKVFNSIR